MPEPEPRAADAPASSETRVEDQDGRPGSLDDLLGGRPAVVAFFYTRCDNPRKCSLTIRTLARVQETLRERRLEGDVAIAAITYDPEFDIPERLHRYGRDRGIVFGSSARFLRVTSGVRGGRTAPRRDVRALIRARRWTSPGHVVHCACTRRRCEESP